MPGRFVELVGPEHRRIVVAIISLLLAGSTLGIAVPAGLGWDFANFYDTGRRVAGGQLEDLYNPNSLIAGQQPQGSMRFWGTPLSSWLYAPLSIFSPETALIVFKIQNTLAYFAALLLLFFHNRTFTSDSPASQSRFAALFAFLVLIYQPFWTVYRVGGQTTPTVFLLLTLALLSHMAYKDLWTASFLVITIMIKPAFVTLVVPILLLSGLRFLAKFLVVSSLAGLASILLMGWKIHEEFFGLMLEGLSKPFVWYYNSSLYVVFENLKTHHHSMVTILAACTKIIVISIFAHVIFKSRRQEWSPAARRHFSFLMAISFFLLISQTLWEHYISVLFLPLVYIVSTRNRFSTGALILVGSIFFLAMGQNLILVNFLRYNFEFDSALELLLIGLFKSGPVLLTLVFVWKYHEELFKTYTAPRWSSAGGDLHGQL